MRRRPPPASRALVVLSVAVAGGTTLVLQDHLDRLEAAAARPGPGTPVVVAAAPLARGTAVDPGDLAVEDVPSPLRPPGALTSLEQATGRTLLAGIAPGEVLTWSRLAPPGGPIAALVPAGLRAVTVTAPLPPGTLVAGDRVDVVATYSAGRPYTETVLHAAEVLRVVPRGTSEAGTTVLLLVGPEDAERLAHARAFADLSLSVAPPLGVEATGPFIPEVSGP